jgi:hypothetical protein
MLNSFLKIMSKITKDIIKIKMWGKFSLFFMKKISDKGKIREIRIKEFSPPMRGIILNAKATPATEPKKLRKNAMLGVQIFSICEKIYPTTRNGKESKIE